MTAALDPARVARAVHLVCAMDGPDYVVRGGAAPHRVTVTAGVLVCDCADAMYRPGVECAHALRVRLMRGDAELIAALQMVVAVPKRRRRRRPRRAAVCV